MSEDSSRKSGNFFDGIGPLMSQIPGSFSSMKLFGWEKANIAALVYADLAIMG